MNRRTIAISDLIRDPELQPRASIDRQTVDEYLVAMRDGADFPPVIAFETNEGLLLVDGFHRVAAAQIAELESVDSLVQLGCRDDAILFTLSGDHPNSTHGLRRTNADKRHAVAKALRLRPQWSDRQIAEWCGVSHTLVSSVRAEAAGNGCQFPEKRLGKDGKERRLPEPRTDPEEASDSDDREEEFDDAKDRPSRQSPGSRERFDRWSAGLSRVLADLQRSIQKLEPGERRSLPELLRKLADELEAAT